MCDPQAREKVDELCFVDETRVFFLARDAVGSLTRITDFLGPGGQCRSDLSEVGYLLVLPAVCFVWLDYKAAAIPYRRRPP